MILTTLSDYAKQKGITRARAYQLKDKLNLVDLPVYAVKEIPGIGQTMYPLVKDGKHLTQTFVQQSVVDLQAELAAATHCLQHCEPHQEPRIKGIIEAIETILK